MIASGITRKAGGGMVPRETPHRESASSAVVGMGEGCLSLCCPTGGLFFGGVVGVEWGFNVTGEGFFGSVVPLANCLFRMLG